MSKTKEEIEIELRESLKNLTTLADINFALSILKDSPYEHLAIERAKDFVAAQRVKNFFDYCPRFA